MPGAFTKKLSCCWGTKMAKHWPLFETQCVGEEADEKLILTPAKMRAACITSAQPWNLIGTVYEKILSNILLYYMLIFLVSEDKEIRTTFSLSKNKKRLYTYKDSWAGK